MAVVVVRMLGHLTDPDTLWHVRAGDLVLDTGRFIVNDAWSASSIRPWVLHQWLPEVGMALFNRAFGLPGVAWAFTLAVAALGLTLWWMLRQRAGLLITALIMILTILGMAASLSPRPQIISFIAVPVVVHAWLGTAQDRQPRWWLIILSWLWACSHGLWVVGPVLGLVAILGMALDKNLSRRDLGRLTLIPVASCLVALVTPVGPELIRSFGEIRQVAPFLNEWQPTPPTNPSFIGVGILVAIPLLISLRKQTPMSWVRILMLALAAGSAVIYGRTVAVGAAIAAPIAAEALQRLVRLRRERIALREVVLVTAVTCMALIANVFVAPGVTGAPGPGPAALNPALRSLPSGTIVCNEDGIGGWLLWEHPDLRPSIDTRMEIYGATHIMAYGKFISAKPGWEDFLKRTGCRVAVLPTSAAVVEALSKQLKWTETAKSGGYVMLEAPSSGGRVSQ